MKAKRKRGEYKTIPTLAKMVDINLPAYRDLHMAIIAKIRDGHPLSIFERDYTAEWLRGAWLPEYEANRRRRYWDRIELLIQTGIHFSPDRPKRRSRESVIARIAEVLGRTPEDLKQRLKDHKTARRLRWADERATPLTKKDQR